MQELFEEFNRSRETDFEKPLGRSTLTSKLDKSKYLEKVARSNQGKTLPTIVKAKPMEIYDDFPDGFLDSDS